MFRTVAIAAALAFLALPAIAETSVVVNVDGLDNKTAHAKILEAAKAACGTELRDEPPAQVIYDQPECVAEAVARADAMMAANASKSKLASR